ncbi:MAG: hypothetical protein EAZ14_09445 [Runella slithyformis]|nr:MAG: hypothetical protein EAZ14_09445 [Runella slithyformis]
MKVLNIVAAVLLIVLASFFYYFVNQNAINVPFFDDFSYLKYVLDLQSAPNLPEFLRLLESKHNGHGVGLAKFVFWLTTLIEGQLNFRTLTLVGSLMVLGLVVYFGQIIRANQLPFAYLLPVGLFLFTPAYYENVFWAAALWQYTASFVMGVLTYYMLAKSTRWTLALAAFFGLLLTYTNGNGLLGMYVGALIPLVQHRYKRTVGWLLACVVATAIYYYFPSGFSSENKPVSLVNILLTVVSFFGSAAYYLRGSMLDVAIFGGLCTFVLLGGLLGLGGIFLAQFWKKNKAESFLRLFSRSSANLSLLALLAWLALTGLAVAITRTNDTIGTALRYMIYSVMTFAGLYVAVLLVLPRRGRFVLGLAASALGVLFAVGTYLFAGPTVVNFRKSLQADAYSLRQHRRLSGKLELLLNPIMLNNFEQAINQKLYVIPTTLFDGIDKLPADTSQIQFKITNEIRAVYGGVWVDKIQNADLSFDQNNPNNGVYVILKNQQSGRLYVNAPVQSPNRNRRFFLQSGHFFNPGFEAQIYQQNLPDGIYQIGVLYCNGTNQRLVYGKQRLEIKEKRR